VNLVGFEGKYYSLPGETLPIPRRITWQREIATAASAFATTADYSEIYEKGSELETVDTGIKEPPPFRVEVLCSRYLSSRAVTRQVLSAYMSLTSVFGMGTGGPS